MMMTNAVSFAELQSVDLQSMSAQRYGAAEGEVSAISFDAVLAEKFGYTEASLNPAVSGISSEGDSQVSDELISDVAEMLDSVLGELQNGEEQDLINIDSILEILAKLIEEYKAASSIKNSDGAYNAVMAYLADFLATLRSFEPQMQSIPDNSEITVNPMDSFIAEGQNSGLATDSKTAQGFEEQNEHNFEIPADTENVNEITAGNAETANHNSVNDTDGDNETVTFDIETASMVYDTEEISISQMQKVSDTNQNTGIINDEIEPEPQDTESGIVLEQMTKKAAELLPTINNNEQASPKEIAERLFEKLTAKIEQKFSEQEDSGLEAIKGEIVFSRTVAQSSSKFEKREEMNNILAALAADKNEVSATDTAATTPVTDADSDVKIFHMARGGRQTSNENDKASEDSEKTNNLINTEKSEVSPAHADRAIAFRNTIDQMTDKTNLQPAAQISEQIAARMKNLENGTTEFEIQLAPDELGKVSIKLVAKGEKISLEIIAERPETAALLRNKAADMSEALRQNSAQLERYVVHAESDTGAQSYLQQENRNSGNGRQEREHRQPETEEPEDETVSFMELMRSMA